MEFGEEVQGWDVGLGIEENEYISTLGKAWVGPKVVTVATLLMLSHTPLIQYVSQAYIIMFILTTVKSLPPYTKVQIISLRGRFLHLVGIKLCLCDRYYGYYLKSHLDVMIT